MLDIMEMWERLAYYGLRVVAPIYIMQADAKGGLRWSARRKGIIYAAWNYTQSLLPMFTGKSGITVNVVAVGTGQAIKNAQNCDADVLLVHAKA